MLLFDELSRLTFLQFSDILALSDHVGSFCNMLLSFFRISRGMYMINCSQTKFELIIVNVCLYANFLLDRFHFLTFYVLYYLNLSLIRHLSS